MTFPVLEQGPFGPWETAVQFNIGFPTGLAVRPANDDAPSGWGTPLTNTLGQPINDGRGTPGGPYPDVLIRRPEPPPSTNSILTRAFAGVGSVDVHTEDWRSDLYENTGEIIRWVPRSENRIGAWTDNGYIEFNCPEPLANSDDRRILFYKNREIKTPREIYGAAIFTRPSDGKKFFIVAGDIGRISRDGIYVIVRPVDHPKGVPDSDDSVQLLSDIPGNSIDNLTSGWAVIAGATPALLNGPSLGIDDRAMDPDIVLATPECNRRYMISSFRFDLTGTKFVFSYNMVRFSPQLPVEEFNYYTHQVHEIDPTSLVITTIYPPGSPSDRTDQIRAISRNCTSDASNDFPPCESLPTCADPEPNSINITNTTSTSFSQSIDEDRSQSQTVAWDWDDQGNLISLEWSVQIVGSVSRQGGTDTVTNGDYCRNTGTPCVVSLVGGSLNSCERSGSFTGSQNSTEIWTYTINGGPGDGLSIEWVIADQAQSENRSVEEECALTLPYICLNATVSCSGSTQSPSSFLGSGAFTSTDGAFANVLALDLRYGYLVMGAQIVEYRDSFVAGGTDGYDCLGGAAGDCPGAGPCAKPGPAWNAPVPVFLGENIPNPNAQTLLVADLNLAPCDENFPGCEGGNCRKGLATRDTQRKIQAVGPNITPGQFDRTFRDMHNRQGIGASIGEPTPGSGNYVVGGLLTGIPTGFCPDEGEDPNISDSIPNPIEPFSSRNRYQPWIYRQAFFQISWAVDRRGDLAFQCRLAGQGRFVRYWFNQPEPLDQIWNPDFFNPLTTGIGGEEAQDDEFFNFYTFQDLDTLTETPGGFRARYYPVRVI